jgi:hypothetical protein
VTEEQQHTTTTEHNTTQQERSFFLFSLSAQFSDQVRLLRNTNNQTKRNPARITLKKKKDTADRVTRDHTNNTSERWGER